MIAPPSALYNINDECDIECSEDCLSLRTNYGLEVVDSCNALRCGCYYSMVNETTCNHDCKAACLFTPGGRHEINECLHDLCDCHDAHVDIAIHDLSPAHFHNKTNHATHEDDHVEDHHEFERHDYHESNSSDIGNSTSNTTIITTNTTNGTNSTVPSAMISLMGYIGYESYLTNGNAETIPEKDLPLITISILFAVFMVFVLGVYFFLLKKEIQNDKKTSMLAYTDKNIYSEKLNFLEN